MGRQNNGKIVARKVLKDAEDMHRSVQGLFDLFVAEARKHLENCMIAPRESVPKGWLGWAAGLRKECRDCKEELLRHGYWMDILVFPMQDGQFAYVDSSVQCLAIPFLTVERPILDCFGRKQLVIEWREVEHINEIAEELREWIEEQEPRILWRDAPQWKEEMQTGQFVCL